MSVYKLDIELELGWAGPGYTPTRAWSEKKFRLQARLRSKNFSKYQAPAQPELDESAQIQSSPDSMFGTQKKSLASGEVAGAERERSKPGGPRGLARGGRDVATSGVGTETGEGDWSREVARGGGRGHRVHALGPGREIGAEGRRVRPPRSEKEIEAGGSHRERKHRAHSSRPGMVVGLHGAGGRGCHRG